VRANCASIIFQLRLSVFLRKSCLGQAPDGVTVAINLQIEHILEFKRSTDRDEGFLELNKAEANKQHQSMLSRVRAAAPNKVIELSAWWVTVDRLLKATFTPS